MYTADNCLLEKEIKYCFPEFKNSEIKFNNSGWTSIIAEIDDKWICKFPRNEEKHFFLKKEKQIIKLLQQDITHIKFPDRIEICEEYPFFMHEKILGEFFTVDDFEKVSASKKLSFIDSIADFFIKIHKLDKKKYSKLLPLKNERIENPEEIISFLKRDFPKTDVDFAIKILDKFNSNRKKTLKTVGYYDMHAYNCVVDPQSKKLIGVFDFDEMAIGTRKFDMREIFLNYNMEIGTQILSVYNKKSEYQLDEEEAKTALVGWSFYEYVKMNKQKEKELKNVANIDILGFRKEISLMINNYTKEFL